MVLEGSDEPITFGPGAGSTEGPGGGGTKDDGSNVSVTITGGPLDFELRFPYVEEVEYDVTGNVSSMTDQCGRTESRRQGDMNVTITINGIVYKKEALALQEIRSSGDTVEVTTDLFTGRLFNQDLTLTHTDKINDLEIGDRRGQGYKFTAQFKSEEE